MAEKTTEDDIGDLEENFSKLAVEEEKSAEKDLFDIAKALGDIFRNWECDATACNKNLTETSRIYKDLLGNISERPDFSDKCKQWCYMFRYMLNHSYLLFSSLKEVVKDGVININPGGNPLNVCVIGGGPGTDILGLCLLLNAKKCVKPWIRDVNVLDNYVEWEESWKQIEEHLPKHLKESLGNVTYSQFDFISGALDKSNQEKVAAAHVVTMTKALSSAAAWMKDMPPESNESPETTETKSVFSILEKMREGAILVYLDNQIASQTSILTTAAKNLGFKVIAERTLDKNLHVPEYYKYIDVRKKFPNQNPCRSSNEETFIILKKPGELSEKVKLEAYMNMAS